MSDAEKFVIRDLIFFFQPGKNTVKLTQSIIPLKASHLHTISENDWNWNLQQVREQRQNLHCHHSITEWSMRTKAGRCCSVPHMHNVPFGTTGQEDRTWSNYTGQGEELGASRENLHKPGVLASKPLLLKQILIKVLSHALVKWLVVLQSLGFIQNIW